MPDAENEWLAVAAGERGRLVLQRFRQAATIRRAVQVNRRSGEALPHGTGGPSAGLCRP